jgi:signal transduction histidine kinase
MRQPAKIFEAILAVPVFVKVMGIAVGLTVFYGLGSFWQIHGTRDQMLREERAAPHTPAELATIEDHVARETEFLTRRLARVMSVMALAGIGLAWWLTKILTHPLDELVGVTRRVKQGDFTARVPVRANDELGDLAVAFNDMTTTLAQKEEARQQLLRQVMAAGEEERKRVARELHDQTGQALTSLIAGLSSLEKSCPRAVELRRLAEQTLAEVHGLSVTLRPAVLDDLGLLPAIRKHCETVAGQFGVEVDCQAVGLDNAQRLPAEIEVALYRITQEALTNALRHGEATRIGVLLQRRDHRVLAVIEDNGRGFDAAHWRAHPGKETHLGLTGIEERAGLFGGTLRVESTPGRGTSLFVELPVS